MFESKKILVAITGGIAAYKAANIVRSLKKSGAQVKVMMTRAAQEFITPLTLATLSENRVYTDMFEQDHPVTTAHIEWAKWPDVIVVAPATANTIAKMAHGFADNVVTTTVLAAQCPIVVCPAMNTGMYENKVYRQNEDKLCELGYRIIHPADGFLACGDRGAGRLAEENAILSGIKRALFSSSEFSGKRFLITAGPTREAIDPVRFISNHSSGKMGWALAEQAVLRGAQVDLVIGPNHLDLDSSVKVVTVESATEMYDAVQERFNDIDVFIATAAVADFKPVNPKSSKLKKEAAELSLKLERTPDILAEMSAQKSKQIIVGFSLETENDIENAIAKKQKKHCDLMVVNNLHDDGAGFNKDTNKVTLIMRDNQIKELPLLTKTKVAEHILDKIAELLK